MSETKHTPGPWAYSAYRASIMSGENLVGIFHNRNGMAVSEANARLIAAAPLLLEALKDLEFWAQIPDTGSKDSVLLRDKARAAIARAEGRQS